MVGEKKDVANAHGASLADSVYQLHDKVAHLVLHALRRDFYGDDILFAAS